MIREDITLRALLLHLELKRPLEFCKDEVQRLLWKLPGSEKVLHRDRTLGILFLPSNLPEVLLARVRPMLDANFADWTCMELGEWSASKNGPMTPFESWMDENIRPSNWRQMRKSQDVTVAQWRKAKN